MVFLSGLVTRYCRFLIPLQNHLERQMEELRAQVGGANFLRR